MIFHRVDSTKEYMGLTTFKGSYPLKSEVQVAKNYLNEQELATLNRMVSAFFDIAELKAMKREPMYMKDWVLEVDDFADRYGEGVLKGSGNISNKQAIDKAIKEYEKYNLTRNQELSDVEKVYLDNLKIIEGNIKNTQ